MKRLPTEGHCCLTLLSYDSTGWQRNLSAGGSGLTTIVSNAILRCSEPAFLRFSPLMPL